MPLHDSLLSQEVPRTLRRCMNAFSGEHLQSSNHAQLGPHLLEVTYLTQPATKCGSTVRTPGERFKPYLNPSFCFLEMHCFTTNLYI